MELCDLYKFIGFYGMILQIVVFLVMTLGNLVGRYQRFRGMWASIFGVKFGHLLNTVL
jgi:hypothetical protein